MEAREEVWVLVLDGREGSGKGLTGIESEVGINRDSKWRIRVRESLRKVKSSEEYS